MLKEEGRRPFGFVAPEPNGWVYPLA